MTKHIANILTSCRILGSILLLFFPAFSAAFTITYLFCGFSDMIDGTIARKTNSTGRFRSRLDTIADLIFYSGVYVEAAAGTPYSRVAVDMDRCDCGDQNRQYHLGICCEKTVYSPAYDDEQNSGTAAVPPAFDNILCGTAVQCRSGMLFRNTCSGAGRGLYCDRQGVITVNKFRTNQTKSERGTPMKFHHISLRVRDFEASLKFYTTLTKLQIAKQFSANGGNVAYLQNAEGETEIELIAMPEGQNFEGKGMFLCFATDDLETAHAYAVKAGLNPSPIRNPEPTAKYFYVYDPDGVSVQLRKYKE